MTDQSAGNNGCSWVYKQGPEIINTDPDPGDPNKGTICIVTVISQALWFEYDGGSNTYPALFSSLQTLTHNAGSDEFILLDTSGRKTVFYDFSATVQPGKRGQFKSMVDPYGLRTKAEYNGSGQMVTFEQKGPSGSTNSYDYAYLTAGANVGRLEYVTLLVDGVTVRRVKFEYYGTSESYGTLGDLKLVTMQQWNGASWVDFNPSYYRYYKSGDPDGFEHGLKFEVGPEAYARMVADSLNPLTATNNEVAAYADKYFEFDVDKRVTLETVRGGSLTFEYSYEESAFGDDYNQWKTKTVETLPDGNLNIVFTNYAGSVMLKVFKSGSDEWYKFNKYNGNNRVILTAESSAVTGYDEDYADLLNYQSGPGKYQYLSDNSGLIKVFDYYTTTGTGAAEGYLQYEKVKKGQLGTAIKLRQLKYVERSVGSSKIYPVWKEIVYRSASSGGSDAVTTEYSYDWYSGTLQIKQKTTTLPVIPTSQNGSNAANSRVEVFNQYGQRTWVKDERGFITRFMYVNITGALSLRIDDVDTTKVPDVPAGWTTPAGGGLNLYTDYESDDLGRTTQELGPRHTVDLSGVATQIRQATWYVYHDADYEKWVGRGYSAGGSYTLINPVAITKRDSAHRVTDEIQATRASTSGKLDPSDTFAQSSWVRWSQNNYDDEGKLVNSRAYYDIPSSGSGTNGVNYNQTEYGYDDMDRRNRVKTPGGTINRTVWYPRSWPASIWVGTNDTGATDSNPAGSGAPNNMVVVQENQYDDGNPGGDGNLTQTTIYASASDTRVSAYSYDFRNRQVAIDSEINFYEVSTYDNQDRVVLVQRRNTSSTGKLIGKAETKYDNLGRVYQTIQYGVRPASGTVTNKLVDRNWYDASGNLIKRFPSGGYQFTKLRYDGLNRLIREYQAYDPNETTYSQAESIDDDTVLRQIENSFDWASNLIEQVTRQRFNDATGSGVLGTPSSHQPKARVSYVAYYPDPVGRTIASANYGTNGGAKLSRLATIPTRSDAILVTTTEFNDRGEAWKSVDPKETENRQEFDDLGRVLEVIQNYVSGGNDASENRTSEYAYNGDGNVVNLTVSNNTTGDQETVWTYGTTLTDSDVASSELLRSKQYPDGNAPLEYKYNRQGQIKEIKDQRGTVRRLDYDKLGRLVQDRVTTLSAGVDGTVKRISRSYEVRGMLEKVSSHSSAIVGKGRVVNQVKHAYNDFGQLVKEYQSHNGGVGSNTPKVEYGYADGSLNRVRRVSMKYPNGRQLRYDYGTKASTDDRISRVQSVRDLASSIKYAEYTYLGLFDQPVKTDYADEPAVALTYIKRIGEPDGDAGDKYTGLDRFYRVVDQRWLETASGTAKERVDYGFDRDSNRQWRQNLVAPNSQDEYYRYDGLQQLVDLDRGNLNSGKTGLAGNDGTAEGGLSYASGEVGQAFSFDGTDDDVKVEASASLDVGAGGGLTLECWIKPSQVTTGMPLIEWSGASSYQVFLWISVTNPGTLYANLVDTTPSNHIISSAANEVAASVFQHVALTYDKASGAAVLYVDGAQVASSNLGTFTPDTTGDLYFGYRPVGSGSGTRYEGEMDEITVYSRALSATEIAGIYNAGSSGKTLVIPPSVGLAAGAVSWWKGENDADDTLGNNDGTAQGSLTYAGGEVGDAFSLNGTNADIKFDASSSLDVGAGGGYTVEGWIKPAQLADPLPIFEWSGPSLYQTHFYVTTTYEGNLYTNIVSPGPSGHSFYSPPNIIQIGIFQHIASTYDKASGIAAMYLNGQVVAQVNFGTITPDTTGDLYLSYRASGAGTGFRFTGEMDEMAVYDRALSAAEIAGIYKAGSAGKTEVTAPSVPLPAGAVGWWKGENNADDELATPTWEEIFTYDPIGNWNQYQTLAMGNVSLMQSRLHNQANELKLIDGSASTVEEEAAGNMSKVPQPSTWGSGYELKWDAWNRLVKVFDAGGQVAIYRYDGLFRRITKQTSEVRHYYYSDQWQILEERIDNSTDADRQFVWGIRYPDDLVLRDRDTNNNGTLDERLYVLHDYFNPTAAIDATGVVRERYGYDAFGLSRVMTPAFEPRDNSDYDWETRYGAYRWDQETGFYQVRYRYLHPTLGRWISRDLIGYIAGNNLYAYIRNRSINSIDLLGLEDPKIEPLVSPLFGLYLDPVTEKNWDDFKRGCVGICWQFQHLGCSQSKSTNNPQKLPELEPMTECFLTQTDAENAGAVSCSAEMEPFLFLKQGNWKGGMQPEFTDGEKRSVPVDSIGTKKDNMDGDFNYGCRVVENGEQKWKWGDTGFVIGGRVGNLYTGSKPPPNVFDGEIWCYTCKCK